MTVILSGERKGKAKRIWTDRCLLSLEQERTPHALKMTEYNLVSGGAAGEGPAAPVAPIKHLKVREKLADLANDRARLRIAETQQLL